MPAKALISDSKLIGYCGKSANPSYSCVTIVVIKELSGVEVPNVTPRLGRDRPGKRESRPPLGAATSPKSEKFNWLKNGLPAIPELVGLSSCISIEAMMALCE